MTQCNNCKKKTDCWIKATIELKNGYSMADLSSNEQRLVIGASNGQCDLFEARE